VIEWRQDNTIPTTTDYQLKQLAKLADVFQGKENKNYNRLTTQGSFKEKSSFQQIPLTISQGFIALRLLMSLKRIPNEGIY